MVGCGRSSVADICDISRANCADGVTSAALHRLKSLGATGAHSSNQERDLHVWLKGLHGTRLQPFKVPMELNVSWLTFLLAFKTHVLVGATNQVKPIDFSISSFWGGIFCPFTSPGLLLPCHVIQVPGSKTPNLVEVPMLLPHELMAALWRAGELQEGKGNSNKSICLVI